MTQMENINNTITYHTLPNGLRIVHQHNDSQVEYCGVAVGVGSRDEAVEQYGLAHFVEHTIFKGTEHRRSWHIINRMEAVGGELNAYTTKEETTIYSIFPYGNFNRAVELIADLITSSQFPMAELDKEREVVADEINSYLDSPSEAIFDDYEDLMFANSSLGHNILGNVETISHFDSDICRRYLSENYTAPNMVFFYMGKTSSGKVIKAVERYLGQMSSDKPKHDRVTPVENDRFDIYRTIDSHQAHTVIGARLPGLYSPLRYAISLFANILGGPGMNSLLNISLRERRGLVYTVEASTAAFTDAGALAIYFGCDPSDVKSCRRLVMHNLERLTSDAIAAKALDAAKKQYIGQLAVASENKEQSSLSIARSMLYYGHVSSSEQVKERILSVTSDDILQVARLVAPANCSVLTFG